MTTINDLLADGISFQGRIWVGNITDEGEEVFFDDEADWYSGLEEDWADLEITYMFAAADTLRIEVNTLSKYY